MSDFSESPRWSAICDIAQWTWPNNPYARLDAIDYLLYKRNIAIELMQLLPADNHVDKNSEDFFKIQNIWSSTYNSSCAREYIQTTSGDCGWVVIRTLNCMNPIRLPFPPQEQFPQFLWSRPHAELNSAASGIDHMDVIHNVSDQQHQQLNNLAKSIFKSDAKSNGAVIWLLQHKTGEVCHLWLRMWLAAAGATPPNLPSKKSKQYKLCKVGVTANLFISIFVHIYYSSI